MWLGRIRLPSYAEARWDEGGMKHLGVADGLVLYPQVPPRPRSLANGYELFEVSEERDEEVAAFCHMLDG